MVSWFVRVLATVNRMGTRLARCYGIVKRYVHCVIAGQQR